MSDDLTYYMECTSRLRAEVEKLREFPSCCYDRLGDEGRGCQLLTERETTMREVAKELRSRGEASGTDWVVPLADRLDNPGGGATGG